MKEYHVYDVNYANFIYDQLTEKNESFNEKNAYTKYRENSRELRARNERDEIREERRRERDRERRLAEKGEHGYRRGMAGRDLDRDISEHIALGTACPNKSASDNLYDQRLFHQDAGLQSSFGNDDCYNLYDKPLFVDKSAGSLQFSET